MCDCNEYEPEFQFVDSAGHEVPWEGEEYQIVGVKLRSYYGDRPDITFTVRPNVPGPACHKCGRTDGEIVSVTMGKHMHVYGVCPLDGRS